jgi:hypothetical protein
MQQSHRTAIESARSRKRSARAEHAIDLTKHPILQRRPWQMMEHRERCHRRKCGIRKRQLRRIALNYAHTGVFETRLQTGCETEIEFNRGQAPSPALQQIRREARAGPQLKQILAQRNILECPWELIPVAERDARASIHTTSDAQGSLISTASISNGRYQIRISPRCDGWYLDCRSIPAASSSNATAGAIRLNAR